MAFRGETEEEIRAKENQKRLFVLIGAVLAFVVELGLGGWGLYKSKEIQEGEGLETDGGPKNINVLRDDLEATRTVTREHEDKLLEFSKPVGWELTVRSSQNPHGTREHSPDELKKFLDDMIAMLELEHGNAEREAVHGLNITGTYTRWSESPPKEKRLTLDKFYPIMINLHTKYRQKAEEHRANAEAQETAAATAWTTARAPLGGLKTGLDTSGEQLKAATNRLVESESAHNTELNDARRGLIAKKDELKQVAANVTRLKQDFNERLDDLRSRIRQAKHKAAEAQERRSADAKIAAVDETSRVAYVNLTVRDRVFPGTVFRVFRVEGDGRRSELGTVEIFEVGETWTKSRILSADGKSYPALKEGDQIYNEFYERDRARHVTFAGRFTGPFSSDDLVARLRDLGDVYTEELTIDSEMVVVGEGFETDPNYLRAADAGLRVLTERYFYEYLGLTFESHSR